MSIQYDTDNRLFRVVLQGAVDAQQVLALLRELFSHPDFYPGAPAIWDGRAADLNALRAEHFQFFREFQAQNAERRGQARIAMVASDDLTFALGRMFQQLGHLPNLEINVFRDMAQAEQWVIRG